jgi:hypothetical protein
MAWDAAVPVAYTLASAIATFDRVDLAWYTIDAKAIVTIERSQTGERWRPIGQATPRGNGLLAFTDRAVTPGVRNGYRLRLADGTTHGETWVDVPIAKLSLLGATPNPSSGPLQISFGLPNSHSAQLELFDISGRRVVSHEVGSFGAGSHVLDLKTRLSASVYLVRLEQDGRTLTRRVLVIR